MRSLRFALVLLLTAATAQAATFQPTRFDDPAPDGCLVDDCSLREAVIAANAAPDTDTVQLAAGDYLLERLCVADGPECGDLDVTTPMAIQGAGSTLTFITNTTQPVHHPFELPESRVLHIVGTSLEASALTLRGGIANNGLFSSLNGGCVNATNTVLDWQDVVVTSCHCGSTGGAMYLAGTMATLIDVVVSNSDGVTGAGIALADATILASHLVVENNLGYWGAGIASTSGHSLLHLADQSRITGNRATQPNGYRIGGGVLTAGNSTLAIDSGDDIAADWLRIEANEAGADGGGVATHLGTSLTLSQVRITGNLSAGAGGGVLARGVLTLRDAEVTQNLATTDGGGIATVSDGDVGSRIERVSVHGNTAGRNGGGIASAAPRVRIENVSSFANRAIGQGGGFHLAAKPHVFRFNTSLRDGAASNSAVHASTAWEPQANVLAGTCGGSGTLTDLGHNVRTLAATGCPGNAMTTMQMGLSFGNWGGAYNVVGFAPTSLLGGLVPASVLPPKLDARGFLRPGAWYDPGAFEQDAQSP